VSSILFATEPAAPANPAALGVGAIALVLAITVLLAWLAFLFVNSRRRRTAELEETPQNLSPYLSDDELENRRSTTVLRSAVVAAALLAIVMTWYAANEPARQAKASQGVADEAVARGEELYHRFGCVGCHGPDAGGGAAPFTEARSNVDTAWVVPSLNDVFSRYDDSEVRFWITYGRAGTPMPANGLEGGGAMTFQEIDDVMAYLKSIQLPQKDILAKRGPAVDAALARIENGADITAGFLAVQEAKIAEVNLAPAKLDATDGMDTRIEELLTGPGTCTPESAKALKAICDQPGADTDRDGLTDAAESELTDLAAVALANLEVLNTSKSRDTREPVFDPNPVYDKRFDPTNPYTNTTAAGEPLADLDTALQVLEGVKTDLLLVRVTAERQDAFLGSLEEGLGFLQRAAERQPWAVDVTAVADAMTTQQAADIEALRAAGVAEDAIPAPRTVSMDDARRAVSLFNGYCARCHTGGWSAGPPFEQGAGSGAWGPAIRGGRAVVQFPKWTDQVDFVIKGTQQGVHYGINGLGSGRMPGFGMVLSREDIELIVMYERSL